MGKEELDRALGQCSKDDEGTLIEVRSFEEIRSKGLVGLWDNLGCLVVLWR
jgi:hypothetical protein